MLGGCRLKRRFQQEVELAGCRDVGRPQWRRSGNCGSRGGLGGEWRVVAGSWVSGKVEEGPDLVSAEDNARRVRGTDQLGEGVINFGAEKIAKVFWRRRRWRRLNFLNGGKGGAEWGGRNRCVFCFSCPSSRCSWGFCRRC